MVDERYAHELLEEAIVTVRAEVEALGECPRGEALRGMLDALERRRGKPLSKRDLMVVLRAGRRRTSVPS